MTDPALATILDRLDRFEFDVNSRFEGVEKSIASLEQRLEVRLAKIEAKLDEKPSHGEVWRSSATLIALAFGLVSLTVAVLKGTGIIP